MDELKKQIKEMISRAAKTNKPEEALRFSQAGLNAAHATRLLYDMKDKT